MKTKLKLLSVAILVAHYPAAFAQDSQVLETAKSAPTGPQIEEIVTLGQYIPDEKRGTAAISNVLDAEAFKAAGDSSVAEGLKRVSGLNLQGGKFVYIRGLGERYSSTVLNGSTLPSPEPVNRVVPLDMFPASIIESVLVQKTFSAQFPAEFAGGTIQMRTKVVPEESFMNVSTSVGYSGNTTGKDGYVYDGGSKDWQGRDDGTRDIPGPLKDAIAGDRELRANNIIYRNGFSKEELEVIGESLSNNYTAKTDKIKPDVSMSTDFGTAGYFGDFRLGALGNLSYNNSWDTIEVSRNTYASNSKGELSPSDLQTFRSTEQSVDTSMFLTGGIEYKDNHVLKGTILQIRKMDDLAGKLDGFQATEGITVDQTRLEWIERDLLSEQIEGEHNFFDFHDLTVNWHYNESRAKQEAPDMRQYRYDLDNSSGNYQFSLRGDANLRMWSFLEDQNTDVGVNAKMFFETPFGTSTDLKFGMTSIDRQRDSEIRRFTFIGQGPLSNSQEVLFRPTLDQIINVDTIAPTGFQLRESTRPTDNYTATQTLDAWYVEADMEVNYWLRMLAGVRKEQSSQDVLTFDLFDKTAAPIVSSLDSDNYFPVVTSTLILDEWDMQVRAGYSETISRPDFRELSPAPFTHPVTGNIIVGNPNLEVTYIKNYDARWEWYFSADESVSVGLFYKQFDAPIESVIVPSSSNERSFINAKDANTYGVEFDTYRWLDFVNEKLENFYVSTNFTLIRSEVSIRPEDSGIVTNTSRRLQGQADFIGNLQLGYDDGFKQKASLVYHITGDKIREVGILGAPDVMDQAYGEVDLNYTRFFGDHVELNVKVKNLTNQLQESTQGGYDMNSYQEGTSASMGLTWTF